MTNDQIAIYVGIDVSKDKLSVAITDGSGRDDTMVESSSDAKCVILMHDRQFRAPNNGQPANPYVAALRTFIEKCQAEGYTFDVISNY